MSESKKSIFYTMIFVTVLSIAAGLITFTMTQDSGIVPLLGLSNKLHALVLNLIWPVIGSMICAILFPRFLAPLYLAAKKYIMADFKNGELEIDTEPYRVGKWFKRSIFVSLLVLGIQALFLGFFPHQALLTPADLAGYEGLGIDIRYVLGVTTGIVGLVTPVAVGLLSVGWAMEDSGLVHYDLPGEPTRIYEVEPVFRRYNSYLKGYAGFSSIIYLLSIVVYFPQFGMDRMIDVVFTLIMPFQAILYCGFGYLAYVLVNTQFLRGRYKKVGQITEDEILS